MRAEAGCECWVTRRLLVRAVRLGTCCTNGPAPRSPNSATTKYFTGIKRAPKTSVLAPAGRFFFFGVGWRSTEKAYSRESLPALSRQRNPPQTGPDRAFSSTASAAHQFSGPRSGASPPSQEETERPTCAPGGPCDLKTSFSPPQSSKDYPQRRQYCPAPKRPTCHRSPPRYAYCLASVRPLCNSWLGRCRAAAGRC